MGLIRDAIGIGRASREIGAAVSDVAGVFTLSKTRAKELEQAQLAATLAQFGREFAPNKAGFDGFINAMNRVPRPAMALGTLGLFVFAMVAPADFSTRMQGLANVPEPLWWLLGAIVSFYFGARELHYKRSATPDLPRSAPGKRAAHSSAPSGNPALEEWRQNREG